MADNSNMRKIESKRGGLAGIRRPPPLNTMQTPPRSSLTPARRFSPRPQKPRKRRSGGNMYMYRSVMRWSLEFVFMCVIPSCSSWFCCVCVPVVLPFGFVMFASPPAFLEAAIANWTLRQVVFYAVWWFVGPVWVTAWALRQFSDSIKQLRKNPPSGLLVASATLPVFLTPWWWGFLWYTSFPTTIGLSIVCSWFFNDPRIKSLGKSIAQVMRGEEFKSFVAKITGTVKVAQKWCERERPQRELNRASLSRPSHPSRPISSDTLAQRRPSRSTNKAKSKPTSILKQRPPPTTITEPKGFVAESWALLTAIIWQCMTVISTWLLHVTGRADMRHDRRLGKFTASGSLLSAKQANATSSNTGNAAEGGVWNSSLVHEKQQQQQQQNKNGTGAGRRASSQAAGDSGRERLPLRVPAGTGILLDNEDDEDGIGIADPNSNAQSSTDDKGRAVRKPGTPWFRPTLPSDGSTTNDDEKEMLVATQQHVATPAPPNMIISNGSIGGDGGLGDVASGGNGNNIVGGNGSIAVDSDTLRQQAWGVAAPRNIATAPAGSLKRREDEDDVAQNNNNMTNKMNGSTTGIGKEGNSYNAKINGNDNNLDSKNGHGVSVPDVGGERVRFQRRNSS